MARNGGGSRIGGFIRGVLMGLVVCAIAAVALSLSAPVPEREAPGPQSEVLGGTAVEEGEPAAAEAVAPETATAPATGPAPAEEGAAAPAEVTVVPAEEPSEAGEPPAPVQEETVEEETVEEETSEEETAAPQPTWQSPAAGQAAPAEDSDAFSAPQRATQ